MSSEVTLDLKVRELLPGDMPFVHARVADENTVSLVSGGIDQPESIAAFLEDIAAIIRSGIEDGEPRARPFAPQPAGGNK